MSFAFLGLPTWPISGLNEKLLAAVRGGIKTVLIPEENAKDLVEISDSVIKRARDHSSVAYGRGTRPSADQEAGADRVGRGERQTGRGHAGRGGVLVLDTTRLQTAPPSPAPLFACVPSTIDSL
jgi:hypothetical protein